jgi:L-lysine 2,3-aminomutase
MIAATPPSSQCDSQNEDQPHDQRGAELAHTPRWQQALADAVTDPAELLSLLQLDPGLLPAAQAASRLFPLRVPRGFVVRMQRGDVHDPLLKQVLPLAAELAIAEGFSNDPVGDLPSRAAPGKAPGVLHKYHGRALLIATGACGVHCRYCFRRHFPYGEENASTGHWRAALDAIRADSSIEELILSGGDPLSLNDRRLHELSEQLPAITHLRRLRIHSRQPVVLPERVDAGLLAWLDSVRLQKVMVLHVNHVRELDTDVARACTLLQQHGVRLFNQTVLLKGVNDSVNTLVNLSEGLFAIGVQPYYLHLLDRVQGAAHFEVPMHHAQQLMSELLNRLPGYLVPKLVLEQPGRASKTPVPFLT